MTRQKKIYKKLHEREYIVIGFFYQWYGKVITKRKEINEFEQEQDFSENPVLLHVRVSATSQRRLFSAADQGTYRTLFDVEGKRGRMCNV